MQTYDYTFGSKDYNEIDINNFDFQLEQRICKWYLRHNKFFKWLHLRHFHGYQNFIIITGDTNSGKSIFADLTYYILQTGMYDKPITLNDFYFGVKYIIKDIKNIVKRCIINHEAGSKGKHWNDKANELWSNILQFWRIARNTYIDCLPHRKDMTDTHLKHATFIIVVDNIIKDWVDDKDNIEDYEIIRVARVYKIHTDYLGFDARSQANSFVDVEFFDYFVIPNIYTDKRFFKFKEFIENEYIPFDLKNKQNLMEQIQDKAEKYEAIENEKIEKLFAKIDKDKSRIKDEIRQQRLF